LAHLSQLFLWEHLSLPSSFSKQIRKRGENSKRTERVKARGKKERGKEGREKQEEERKRGREKEDKGKEPIPNKEGGWRERR